MRVVGGSAAQRTVTPPPSKAHQVRALGRAPKSHYSSGRLLRCGYVLTAVKGELDTGDNGVELFLFLGGAFGCYLGAGLL